jgi:hypothetical protein
MAQCSLAGYASRLSVLAVRRRILNSAFVSPVSVSEGEEDVTDEDETGEEFTEDDEESGLDEEE